MRRFVPLALALLVGACDDDGAGPPPPRPCTMLCTAPTLTKLDLVAGQPGGPGWVDGAGAAAHFIDPWSFAFDGMDHLYLADGQMIRVIQISTANVTTLAGSLVAASGMDGVGAQASFNTPSGLAFTGGALYVTDTENHTIRKIDVASATVTTVAGTAGMPGTTDANGTAARFREPEGLALDASGNLYIADVDNNTIRKMVLATGDVSTFAGTAGTSGAMNGIGAAAQFSKPKEMTFDGSANLYVVDSLNQSIRQIALANAQVSTLITFATQLPNGVAVDGTDVLVALSDHTIVRVAPGGTSSVVAGATNMPGFVDAVGAQARLNQPSGLVTDGAGSLYIADNQNSVVRKIALASSTVSTFAGARSKGSDDGVGAQARFLLPQGLAADDANIWVADSGNHTLRHIDAASAQVTTFAGAAGQPGTTDGAGGDARFNVPQGLALDGAAQLLYVADSNNHSIRKVDLASGRVTTLSYNRATGDKFTNFNAPAGLALDQGRLYISDYGNHDILAFDLAAGLVSTLAGKQGVPGHADGVGTMASFNGPFGLSADGRGNLFVADDQNDTVRQIDLASGTVTTLAGGFGAQGTADGVGTAAGFAFPDGVAADGVGDLFVGDSLNDLVRHVDVPSATVSTIIGVSRRPGVKLGPLPAQLTNPQALALTPSGGLLVISENAILLAH
jgi:sugar lactone lactonase YvrE